MVVVQPPAQLNCLTSQLWWCVLHNHDAATAVDSTAGVGVTVGAAVHLGNGSQLQYLQAEFPFFCTKYFIARQKCEK